MTATDRTALVPPAQARRLNRNLPPAPAMPPAPRAPSVARMKAAAVRRLGQPGRLLGFRPTRHGQAARLAAIAASQRAAARRGVEASARLDAMPSPKDRPAAKPAAARPEA